MTWPIDKIAICFDALGLTGNNVPSTADDGSPEWTTASIAYEAALPYAIEGHDWKYATIVKVLTPAANVPSDPLFDTAYGKPQDLLHLIWVRINNTPANYQILDNQIVLRSTGVMAGNLPGTVTAKYVYQPTMDRVTPTFAMGLRAFTMSGIYSGLNKQFEYAAAAWKQGENFMAQGRARSDQEAPKRAMFNSRVTAARRIRRPTWPIPTGWGGTGAGS